MTTNSSSAFQFDYGKMLSVVKAAHHESDNGDLFPSGLKVGYLILDSEVHVHGDTSTESLMRTLVKEKLEDITSRFECGI